MVLAKRFEEATTYAFFSVTSLEPHKTFPLPGPKEFQPNTDLRLC